MSWEGRCVQVVLLFFEVGIVENKSVGRQGTSTGHL